jgi:hypothetical protein
MIIPLNISVDRIIAVTKIAIVHIITEILKI